MIFHFLHFQALTCLKMAACPYAAREPLIFRGSQYSFPLILTGSAGREAVRIKWKEYQAQARRRGFFSAGRLYLRHEHKRKQGDRLG